MNTKSKIIINCQYASVRGSGGAGTYAQRLAMTVDRYLDPDKYELVVDNFMGERFDNISPVEMVAKDILRRLLPKGIFTFLKKLYLKNEVVSKDGQLANSPMPIEKTILHEVTNYWIHPKASRILGQPNAKLVATFLDIQDFFYPEFFKDDVLNHRRTHYAYLKEYGHHFIAISEHTKQTMIDCLQIEPEKISVVHLAAERAEVKADPKFTNKISEYGNYFIYPAKFWKHKNHQFLLESFSKVKVQLQSSKTKLILCGGFSMKDLRKLNAMISSCGLENNVIVLGFVTSNQLRLLLSRAQYLVFPSLFEGFGMPILEAMGLDCPVISSTAGSLKEVCGDAALLFDPLSQESLVEKLKLALDGKIDRENLKLRGRQNFALFSWEKCVQETAEIYKSLLA